ncbi:MAG: PIG-L family deacetylase [Candidatus Omnitrophota bacterium]
MHKIKFIIFSLVSCFILLIYGFLCEHVLAADSQIRDMRNFVPFTNTDRVLIIAPHPDDETIGCAGIIQKAAAAGADVRVLYLTNGDHNQLAFMVYEKRLTIRKGEFIHMGEVRRKEAITAMKVLGLEENKLIFLGYPDFGTLTIFRKFWQENKPYKSILTRVNSVPYKEDFSYGNPYTGISILNDFKKVLMEFRPNKVFVTSSIDINSDHKAACLFLQIALSDLQKELPPPEIYTYLIHWKGWPSPRNYHADSWILPPKEFSGSQVTWYKNILTPQEEQKKYKATLCYKSQTQSSAFYLLAFVRKNELFGQYLPIDLDIKSQEVVSEAEREDSSIEKIISFFGLSGDEFLTDNSKKNPESIIIKGKCAIDYELIDDLFIIHIGKQKSSNYRCINSIYLYGYSYKTKFGLMPKIYIITKHNRFQVFDGNKIKNPEGMILDFKPEEVILKIPLKVLGNPDYVLASVRSHKGYYCVDRRVFRKVNIYSDVNNAALSGISCSAEFNPSTEISGFKTGDECCIVFSAQEEATDFSPGSFTN